MEVEKLKMEIKKIQDRSKRQVIFTKRRQGLFKKAGQLHSMCDADVVIIAFSLAENSYAFDDPSVSSILDRYLQADAVSSEDKYSVAVNLTLAEKKVGEILEKAVETKVADGRSVWDKEVEKLGFGEIEEMENVVEEMKKLIGLQKRRILSNESNCGE